MASVMVGLPLALIAQQCARPWTRLVVMGLVLVVEECEVTKAEASTSLLGL